TPAACAATTCGYQEFAPGVALTTNPSQCPSLAATSCTTPAVGAPAADGKGWIVDANGDVTFPSGTWTLRASTKLNIQGAPSCLAAAAPNGPCVVHLVFGMWESTTVPFPPVSTPLIDPTSSGENATNLATTSGTQ